MELLSLSTPSILFSAVSLIMLAYTNRFLSYAQLIRTMSSDERITEEQISQIENLRKRLYMTRRMQIWGILSLFLCVVSTFLIFVGWQNAAIYVFAIALICLIISLAISIRELYISVNALDIHLDGVKNRYAKRKTK